MKNISKTIFFVFGISLQSVYGMNNEKTDVYGAIARGNLEEVKNILLNRVSTDDYIQEKIDFTKGYCPKDKKESIIEWLKTIKKNKSTEEDDEEAIEKEEKLDKDDDNNDDNNDDTNNGTSNKNDTSNAMFEMALEEGLWEQ